MFPPLFTYRPEFRSISSKSVKFSGTYQFFAEKCLFKELDCLAPGSGYRTAGLKTCIFMTLPRSPVLSDAVAKQQQSVSTAADRGERKRVIENAGLYTPLYIKFIRKKFSGRKPG